MPDATTARRRHTLRLFVAAYPDEELLSFLRERFDRNDWPAHRRVANEQIHLTLCFMGDRAAGKLDGIRARIAEAIRGIGPLESQPLRLIGVPKRGKARLVAAELEGSETLCGLQRRLVDLLLPEDARKTAGHFLPHLTLCRFRTPTRLRLENDVFARRRTRKRVPHFSLGAIRLMCSELRPQGAEHRCIEEFELCKATTAAVLDQLSSGPTRRHR